MVDLQHIADSINSSAETLSGRLDSIFLDEFSRIFPSIFIWLPLFLLIVLIILRNNDSRNSIRIFIALMLAVPASLLSAGYIDPSASSAAIAFCLAIFFIWLLRYRHLSYLLLIIATIYSFTHIYNGVADLTGCLIGILIGTASATVIYLSMRMISRKDYKFYWNESNTNYTRTGYLISDIDWIFCIIYTLLIFTVFYSIVA